MSCFPQSLGYQHKLKLLHCKTQARVPVLSIGIYFNSTRPNDCKGPVALEVSTSTHLVIEQTLVCECSVPYKVFRCLNIIRGDAQVLEPYSSLAELEPHCYYDASQAVKSLGPLRLLLDFCIIEDLLGLLGVFKRSLEKHSAIDKSKPGQERQRMSGLTKESCEEHKSQVSLRGKPSKSRESGALFCAQQYLRNVHGTQDPGL